MSSLYISISDILLLGLCIIMYLFIIYIILGLCINIQNLHQRCIMVFGVAGKQIVHDCPTKKKLPSWNPKETVFHIFLVKESFPK